MNSYTQTNLTSDLPGVAANQDTQLVNPWGLAASPTSPFWVNDNKTGLSTLYNGSGTKQGLVVTVPPPAGQTGPSAPTGMVFNGTSGFGGSHFIFDTEDGTISAWTSGASAVLQVTSAPGSVYKGLAIGSTSSGPALYATNFGLNRIDVFGTSFQSVGTAGNFADPNLPAGYSPFNIQNLNGSLYVTYALQDSAHHDDVSGPGNGFVDQFDLNGNFIRRVASQGVLNSPWGLAVATSNFGAFSNDLLVGNFGNGLIDAYDPTSGAFVGTLDDPNGNPVVIPGLWALSFGNGALGQGADSLFFTAGIPGPDNVEDHGLFGDLSVATPEPASALLLGLGGLGMATAGAFRRRHR
jgi:uncharacterized protein (TIGR03118 family)